MGERRDGLYYFRDFPKIGALNIDEVSSSNLWHQRLDHPSSKVMRTLPFLVKSCSGTISIKIQGPKRDSKDRTKEKLENRVSKKSRLDFPGNEPKANSALGS